MSFLIKNFVLSILLGIALVHFGRSMELEPLVSFVIAALCQIGFWFKPMTW